MKILELETRSLPGLADGTFRFHDHADPRAGSLTVVTGPTASGKTRLLEAIATAKQLVASIGLRARPERILRCDAASGRLVARWHLNEGEMRFAETEQAVWTTVLELGANAPVPLVPSGVRRLFAAHPSRTVTGLGGMELFDDTWGLPGRCDERIDDDEELSLRLERSPRKYVGLAPWLASVVVAQGLMTLEALEVSGSIARSDWPDALGKVRDRLRPLLPHLQLVSSELGARVGRIVFQRRGGPLVGLEELSRGEQRRVLFALAFERFKLDESIVLVDDIEANAGQDAGAGLVRALMAQAPRAQVIATCGMRWVGEARPPRGVIALEGGGA